MGIIGMRFVGFIVSAIAAAIMKKSEEETIKKNIFKGIKF